ncbi:MAG: hypothetical protein H6618_05725 [Deltaproteobacteria bacterium]|nr:hypothetical protein [Deltaproteobacteria bacterium]
MLSLVTLASAINAGYSVSFRKTNGYFCVYNKALIASIGVSLASATFLAVAMGLEKPGENFDNILQILGIGAGSLITLQAIATGLFGFINEKKFSSGKNLGGELESWISYYVNNKELPEDLEKVIKELNDNAFRGLTDTEKSKIKTFVTTEINKKDNYAKPEIKNKKDDITDKITKFLEARKKLTNTLHIEETDLDKLHQFLDLNFGPEIEVIHENLENFKKDPNFNTMVSGSYRAGGDTPEYIKGYNKVRSLFRQYLQSQGIETKGLYTETFYHYAESYRDLVTKDKIPAQYLFKLKESPEDLSAVDWSSWNKRSEIIRALEYNKVEGIPRTNWSQYGSINGEIFHVQFYNEVSSLNKKMMVGSIVGLAAGVTTIVSSIQKDSPLRLAETQSFDSLLYKVGKKISRLQELLQNY